MKNIFCFRFFTSAVFVLCAGVFFVSSHQAFADYSGRQHKAMGKNYAKKIANACLKKWESQACLAAVSESTLDLAANYGGDLHKKGHEFAVEEIKEHCAAGTAATEGEYPAYAMKSAWIECANTMFDLAETTGIEPNASHYQLLVGPILCLEKDRRCVDIERGLGRFAD